VYLNSNAQKKTYKQTNVTEQTCKQTNIEFDIKHNIYPSWLQCAVVSSNHRTMSILCYTPHTYIHIMQLYATLCCRQKL